MKENITIDLPENHAVDVLAREIAKLKHQAESIQEWIYELKDEDRPKFDHVILDSQKKLDDLNRWIKDCQDGIKYIYSEILD